ncbi:hypothetical protein ACFV2H_28265 [Streptomyces sp. NPDC059629]|uniref:hypothetical protein n=1 Tax=Streptomyces sp. NPDC059629 TaxID=3346889 RepID=UPI0036C754F6
MADDRPVPLDEYPVHQVPLSMKHVATGDRNAYDRCIFHVLDHRGRALLILGLGVYPNVGVIDAYATLVRPGHRDRQLGWPHTEITYRSGTRHPERAVIHLGDPRKPQELEAEILASSPLAVGAGYPPADDWQHGTWQGRAWVDRRTYDLTAPHPRAAYGVTDHSARFRLDGRVGYGIFEHGSFGRHGPSGFTGFDSVAP